MNYPRILLCVAIMAGVTYLVRMLPLAVFKKKINNQFVQSFLAYVPYAVLAAMTFPEILFCTENMAAAAAGFGVALLLAWRNKGLLTVALGSTAMVFIVEQSLKFLIK